jgi:ankyrin repeat protein
LQVDAGGNQEQAKLRRQHDCVDSIAEENNNGKKLLQAAESGDDESVERLLGDDQLDPNLKDNNDCTPLLLTVLGKSQFPEYWGHPEQRHDLVAKLLLADRRLNPNCRDNNGRTPLSHAAECGDTDLIEQLLKHEKIEPNCIDVIGHTPLSRAAATSQAPAVRMLIKHRLIPESKDTSGRTALSWAMKCFEHEQFGSTENQQCGIVELLLSLDDVDANSRDKEGRTPLSWAITYLPSMCDKLPTAFQTLLDRSSDSLSSKDSYGRTLLSRAAELGKRTVIKKLLRKSIHPDMRDDDGRTPLSRAAADGHYAEVLLLLQQEAIDPDSRDKADRTPLWWAAKGGHEDIIELLLEYKVEPDPIDQDLCTPLLCAMKNKHASAIELLLKRDKNTLHILAQDGVLDPLQFLLTEGSNVNARNIDGRTPLHTAAKSGHVDIARELICWTADINCKDTDGKTPLLLALEGKRHGLVQLLLKHSAQTKDVMSAQWLDAYEKEQSEVVVELSQSSCGKQSLRFIEAHQVNVLSQMGLARRLL